MEMDEGQGDSRSGQANGKDARKNGVGIAVAESLKDSVVAVHK